VNWLSWNLREFDYGILISKTDKSCEELEFNSGLGEGTLGRSLITWKKGRIWRENHPNSTQTSKVI